MVLDVSKVIINMKYEERETYSQIYSNSFVSSTILMHIRITKQSIPSSQQTQLLMEMDDHIFQPVMHPLQVSLEVGQSTITIQDFRTE